MTTVINRKSLYQNRRTLMPVCRTDQKAITFLQSTLNIRTMDTINRPKRTMKSIKPRNRVLKKTLTTKNLYIPKKPTLRMTLASMQLISVLASTCTSGNQECKGHNGYLTENTTNRNNHKKSHKQILSKPKSVHTSTKRSNDSNSQLQIKLNDSSLNQTSSTQGSKSNTTPGLVSQQPSAFNPSSTHSPKTPNLIPS